MKKILISLLIVLLLVLVILTCVNGLKIGNIEVLSLGQIQTKNQELDDIILQATTLASTDYENVLKDIESDTKKLQEEKQKYDELVTVSTGSEVQAANQYQKYEIEYLWTIIGNHATKEGVVIKMDLVSGTGDNVYNLNFTVTGAYIGIADFISDIENDSALGFKIENFYLVPGSSTDSLRATFTCKDITIRDIASSARTTTTTTDTSTNTNTNTNTKDTTTTDSDSTEATATGTNNANNSSTNSNNSNNSKSSTDEDDDDFDEDDLENELEKLDRE